MAQNRPKSLYLLVAFFFLIPVSSFAGECDDRGGLRTVTGKGQHTGVIGASQPPKHSTSNSEPPRATPWHLWQTSSASSLNLYSNTPLT